MSIRLKDKEREREREREREKERERASVRERERERERELEVVNGSKEVWHHRCDSLNEEERGERGKKEVRRSIANK